MVATGLAFAQLVEERKKAATAATTGASSSHRQMRSGCGSANK
jgi:hypothetical protein